MNKKQAFLQAQKEIKMANEKREMLRVQMHMELNVLLNKMFTEFPHVDNFLITIDHIENNNGEQVSVSSSANSEVGIEGARTDRIFLHYVTQQGAVIIDKESIID